MDPNGHLPSYCTQYALGSIADPSTFDAMLKALSANKGFVKEDTLTLALVKLRGYQNAAADVENAHLTMGYLENTAKPFVGSIIESICSRGGDVVRILGDTLLINFGSSVDDELEWNQCAHNAIASCVDIMTRLSFVLLRPEVATPTAEISNLSPEQASLLFSTVSSPKQACRSISNLRTNIALPPGAETSTLHQTKVLKAKDGQEFGGNTHFEPPSSIEIVVNIVLATGPAHHVVIGAPSKRLDYFIHSHMLGDMFQCLDTLSRGEIAFGLRDFNYLSLNFAKSRDLTDNYDVGSISTGKVLGGFDGHVDRLPSDPTYHGDLNLQTTALMPSTTEYRRVSLMVITLLWDFDMFSTQKCIDGVLDSLYNYFGVYDQISVLNSVQTITAFFGLSPLEEYNCSEMAIKSALDILWTLSKHELGPVSISVVTSDVLFQEFKTDYRCLLGSFGDAYQLALNMLKWANNTVVCDHATHLQSEIVGIHEKVGYELSRNKQQQVPVWTVRNQYLSSLPNQASLHVGAGNQGTGFSFGYRSEREILVDGIKRWFKDGERMLAVIEGTSGAGKTSLIKFLKAEANAQRMMFCLTSGFEIEQWTPYVGIQKIIAHILSLQMGSRLVDKPVSTLAFSKASLSSGSRATHRSIQTFDGVDSETIPALEALGVARELACLIKHVIPKLQIKETERVQKLDGQARVALLKSTLFRIIQTFTSDPNPAKRTVFVIDDTQWIDAISLEVLHSVARTCKNICMLFFTRPISDYNISIFDKLLAIPNVTHLQLQGLSIDETEQLMVWQLREKGVVRMQSDLMAAVFKLTSGSPLFVNVVLQSLSDIIPKLLEVVAGELRPRNSTTGSKDTPADIKSLLVKDLGAGISSQFQGLNPDFKVFLQRAAVFGQNFDLHAMKEAYKLQTEPRDLVNWIVRNDQYSFLIHLRSADEEEGEDEASVGSYAFRHIAIANSIYDSIEEKERRLFHEKVGEYYESMSSNENKAMVMPIASYHFGRANDVKKALRYMEDLGIMLFNSFMLDECIEIFEQLIEKVDALRGGSRLLALPSRKVTRGQVTIERRKSTRVTASPDMSPPFTEGKRHEIEEYLHVYKTAKWFSYIGSCFAQKKALKEAVANSTEALKLLGVHWPSNDKEMKKQILSAAVTHWRLWRQTKGGRRRRIGIVRHSEKEKRESKHPETIEIEYRALISIRDALLWDPTNSKPQILLILLMMINHSILHFKTLPENLACDCCKMAFLFHIVFIPMEKIYRRRADELARESLKVKEAVESQYLFLALSYYPDGHVNEALESTHTFVRDRSLYGDFSSEYVGLCYIGHMEFWRGKSVEVMEANIQELIVKYSEIVRLDVVPCIVAGSFIVARYLAFKGLMGAASPWSNSAEEHRCRMPGKILQSAFLVPKIIECIDRRNLPASLSIFSQVAFGLMGIDLFLPGPIECMLQLGILGIFILHPDRNWDEKRQPLKPQEIDILLEGFRNLRIGTAKTKKSIFISLWAFEVADAACSYLSKPIRDPKAFYRLKRLMRSAKYGTILAEQRTIVASLNAVLGICENEAEERKRLLSLAAECFFDLKLMFLYHWVASWL
ncbi:hypothetical protein HDU67_006268 [Dinochytrium kinnereticum]|nr:hypothetical protein HDU67_006268 [Dinochytrium kinnereticum]